MVKKISRQDGGEGPTDEARDQPEETSDIPNATTSGNEDEKAKERLN